MTLQRWDREGTLKANRTPTDRRYYTYDQYLQFKGINTENDNREVVIYARVSTRNQKDDLQNQMILSILVDTFISKISFPMQPGPEIGSISDA